MRSTTFIVQGQVVQSRLRRRYGIFTELALRKANEVAAIGLLVLLSPLMLAAAALIWRKDGCPIFFGHYRVGRGGELFKCYKFRTMVIDSQPRLEHILRTDPTARAEWDRDQKLTQDPRVTPIGRFLRRTSLDELPQLFNVLRGDMNLVGPRPITVPELERYGPSRWHYLEGRPGMTGLWQVSGRSSTSYEERVSLDRAYVEQRGFWSDVAILGRTVRVVVAKDGAH